MSSLISKARAMAARTYRRMVDGEPDDVQDLPAEQRIRVEFAGCIPDGDDLIVRTSSTVHASCADVRLVYSARDAQGAQAASETVVMSRTLHEAENPGEDARCEVMASTRVKRADMPVSLCVEDADGLLAAGSRNLNMRRLRRMLGDWKRTSTSTWDDPAYGLWFGRHRASEADLAWQREASFAYEPTISIVVPLFNTPIAFFRDMVTSVLRQSYGHWELVLVNASPDNRELAAELAALDDARVRVVALERNDGIVSNTNAGIAAATGDFVAFLDHDDFLEPDALYWYVDAMNAHEGCDLLYCDEDSFTVGGRFVHPHFKPDFNRDLLYAHNYITHFLMVRASVVREVGTAPAHVEGAQDYDLTLRVAEAARAIAHVPRVLYHWRIHSASTSVNVDSKRYAQDAGRRALQDHFARRGIAVTVEDGADPFTYEQVYALDDAPLVSIVIPTKDHIDVLEPCISSILQKATYPNFEVVLVENNSTEPETFAYYDEACRDERVRVVRFDGAFNYSRVINFGVSQARGDYLLLLNNDTQVISPDFIERMVGPFARDEVGIVGAKLLHPDGTVQHAGVVIGRNDEPWHMFMQAPDGFGGYMGRANRAQDYLAVTGACQMVKRSVFDEVGGYDEQFAIAFNDIDFCCKVHETGKLVVYVPQAKLFHREFTSRGRDVSAAAKARFFGEKALLHVRWPRFFVEGDPYYNPNLDRDSLFFALGRR